MKSTKLNIKNGIFKKTIIPKVCLHQRKGGQGTDVLDTEISVC